jgi:hypothetical protein
MTQLIFRSFTCRTRSIRILPALAFCAMLAAVSFTYLAPAAAQTNSRVASVDPTSGKVNDSVTASGEGLGKGTISAVFLSDDKNDYKAAIVEQQAEKIVFKVPQVRTGSYNVSIQIGGNLLIQPVKFSVTE